MDLGGIIQHPHIGDRTVLSSPNPCSTACPHFCWLPNIEELCHIAAVIQWGQGGSLPLVMGIIPKKSQTHAIEHFLHSLLSELPRNGFTQCSCLPNSHFGGK